MKREQGFTLIEVIAVLLIIGIISAVVYSSSEGIINSQTDYECETLKSYFSFARLKAMAFDTIYGVKIEGTKLTILKFNTLSLSTPVIFPGKNSATIDLGKEGVKSISNCFILFDQWGSPYDGTTLKKRADISISVNNTNGFTIREETGSIS